MPRLMTGRFFCYGSAVVFSANGYCVTGKKCRDSKALVKFFFR